jgi:predicted TIM-barrel fold metal-dependent hydrolase
VEPELAVTVEPPKIISVDDHVVEPPDLWTSRLPSALRDRAPRVDRRRGWVEAGHGKPHTFHQTEDGQWGDVWLYDSLIWPLTPTWAAAGFEKDELVHRPATYDEIRPGCYDRIARIEDMDVNHLEASFCFPTFPRFCGQTFLNYGDRETSLACVKAYNDFMIDEWCAGPAYGRLIPVTIVPLWDVDAAVAEVRRCAAKGAHAISFSENPSHLGLPTWYSHHWDPLWAACQETDTVINCHIGSSSRVASTGPDSPQLANIALSFQGSLHAAIDLLLCGLFERFDVKVALSEGQIGWMPFILERLDNAWVHARGYSGMGDRLKRPPSTYMPGHLYGCLFDDLAGLSLRNTIGMDQIMFETDYPHGDSTWPNTLTVLKELVTDAGMSARETWQLVRGNAIACYGLKRFGIES